MAGFVVGCVIDVMRTVVEKIEGFVKQ